MRLSGGYISGSFLFLRHHQPGHNSTAAINVDAPDPMEMKINMQLEENEPLGARPNDGLVITEVQEGTPAFGHLQVSSSGRGIQISKNMISSPF